VSGGWYSPNLRKHGTQGVTHPTETDELVGRTIGGGKYTLLRVIGRGGFATVFAADQLNVNRQVAIKMARPMIADQAMFVERFRREVSATVRLEGEPHILPVYDVGDEDGMLYMVMRLIPGGTLCERMVPNQPFTPETSLKISDQVLAALDYAHREGFIHRDVKPSNILCNSDHIYLSDFGIAKAIQDAAEVSPVTQMRTLTGNALVDTPAYMAPEQVLGSTIDRRADLYSFGAILYEMLTRASAQPAPTRPVPAASTVGAANPPRAGGLPLQVALLAGLAGAAMIGLGLYVLRKGPMKLQARGFPSSGPTPATRAMQKLTR
jgi:serine/threonine protein kinase